MIENNNQTGCELNIYKKRTGCLYNFSVTVLLLKMKVAVPSRAYHVLLKLVSLCITEISIRKSFAV